MVEQLYHDDGSTTLVLDDGSKIECSEFCDWQTDQWIREYERNGKQYRTPRPHELAEIFPEAKAYLKQRKKDISGELQQLIKKDRRINEVVKKHKHRHIRLQMLMENESTRAGLLEERENNDVILGFMNPKKSKAVKDFNVELLKAKSYPIDRLLDFRHNKARCIWHSDRNPSLYYYRKDNRVHCFVCEKGGDTIDVVMQMRGCSIGEAISFINRT